MALSLAEDGGLTRPKFLDRVLRFRKIALIAAYIGCFVYCQWCFDPANMEVTRISEHSLMPGLVTPRFEKSGIAIQMYRKLNELPKTKSQQQFIVDTFNGFGLQCYTQKWKSTIAAEPMSGQNVYGFIRGHRNDGAEAQLIVVQLGKSESARRMIARMLAFIDYAKDQVYWARDFVFVFVDGGEGEETTEQAALAMEAFLLKYQKIESISSESTRSRAVQAEEIQAQTGALIAGVVYDLSGMAVKGTHVVSIQTNGINGQQVNLDVFNGIVKIADSKHSSRVAIFGTLHRHSSPYMDASPYTVPMKAIYTQAFVPIEGIHSVMGKYGVQGLTVGLSYDYSERQTGQFIEEVSRMLNNVLERLHQSYFMYVLADDMHFASVAFYMPIIGILITPLLISAYYEWTKIRLFQMPFLYLIVHCLGFAIYISTVWIYSSVGTHFVIQWIEFPFYGVDGCDGQLTPSIPLIPTFVIAISFPIGIILFWKSQVGCIRSMRMLLCLESALVIGSLSLINFGLSILSAAITVPMVFLTTFPSCDKARSAFRTAVLAVISPMAIICYMSLYIPSVFGVADEIHKADYYLATRLSYKMLKQHMLFGTQQFFIFCVTAYPVWNLLFACSMHVADEEEENEPTTPLGRSPRGGKGKKNKRK